MRLTSWPNRWICPRVGVIDMNIRRSSDVFPAPEGPVRKWNEPGRKWKLSSASVSGPRPYFRPMFCRRITAVFSSQQGGSRSNPQFATTLLYVPYPIAARGTLR